MRQQFHRTWAMAICAVVLAATSLFVQVSSARLRKDNKQPPDASGSPVQADAQDNKNQKSSSTVKLRIEVSSSADKPISNASVYVRFPESGGIFRHDKLAELSLKTNEDGSVKVPAIPQGKILIQVVAAGWHTYGKWYDIDMDEELVRIKLDPPPHWY